MTVKELRDAYRSQWRFCQYRECVPGACCPGLELDHVWSRGVGREHWSNYISACPCHHRWKTDNAIAGRIAAMWIKRELALETGDMRHFDLEVLDKACGKGGGLMGWVESVPESSLPGWCRELRRELLQSEFYRQKVAK